MPRLPTVLGVPKASAWLGVTTRLALRSQQAGARGRAPQARSAAPKHYNSPPVTGTFILCRAPQARSAAPKQLSSPPHSGDLLVEEAAEGGAGPEQELARGQKAAQGPDDPEEPDATDEGQQFGEDGARAGARLEGGLVAGVQIQPHRGAGVTRRVGGQEVGVGLPLIGCRDEWPRWLGH